MTLGEMLFWAVAASVPVVLFTYGMYIQGIAEALCWREVDDKEMWPVDVFPMNLRRPGAIKLLRAAFFTLLVVCYAFARAIGILSALGLACSIYVVSIVIAFILVQRWIRLHPEEVHRAAQMRSAGCCGKN